MNKVGILSMQRICNYGSFLQAYGLKMILEDLECDVEFVDYHFGECLIPANGGMGIFRKFSKVMEVLKYTTPLKEKIRFIKYKKNFASNYYSYLGINKEMNFTPELDLLVIGSDEVFNCVQSNTNVGFSSELFGEGNHAKRVITYAASFGNTTMQKLEQYKVKEKVEGWMRKIDAMSVRDVNSGAVAEALTGKIPRFNLDPVLIYDFINRCKEIPTSVPEVNYIILYGYSGRFSKEECKVIRFYAKEKNLKVFCFGGVQNCCDRFIDCNPFQVITYFQHAECVITDTFHGTIMSIITHRRFVSFVRNVGYGNSEKLPDLLERLHLSKQIMIDIGDFKKNIENKIQYNTVDSIIEAERKHTYDYLREEIELCTQN